MSAIEDRMEEVNARLAARMSALEDRIAARFGGERETPPDAPPSDGVSAEGAEAFSQKAASAPSRGSGTRYGLFVGVNHSPCGNVLSGCINDANCLRKACVELGGWFPGNATVLEDAKGADFLSKLAVLAGCARPGDEVLILFSGHGGSTGGQPDNDFVFAMNDGPLPEKDFRKALSAFNRAVKIVIIVDACNSDAAAVAGPAGTAMLPNVGWIAASTSWQSSADGFQGRKNGFLTGALLDGWCKGGAAGMADHVKNSAEGGPALRAALAANPPVAPESVTFLDLAVFVAHSWRYWHPGEQQPQYHNPALLHAVVAGRTGT